MQIGKTAEQLQKSLLKKSDLECKDEVRLGQVAEELWKDSLLLSEGKSIHQAGLNPNKNVQLHRMEADRLEEIADRIANMGVYAMVSGDNANSKTLMSRAEEIRRVSNLHRRQAELL